MHSSPFLGLPCSYNVFGRSGEFDYVDAIPAWDDCIAELDYRKAATNTPDMKLVISMSWSTTDENLNITAQTLANISQERSDVLFVAAAGNDNNNVANYPAYAPEVVSVAAVDWTGLKAYFSNFNADIEW